MPYYIIVSMVIICDQLAKFIIVDNFRLYETKEIIPSLFHLTYVTNNGAAFSLLADVDSPWRHYFFVGVGTVALVAITVAYFFMRKQHRFYGVALALIAGGAVGNLIDRVRVGAVVDFLVVYIGSYQWPAFNVADSAICVGAALFLYINFHEERKKKKME
jgi:signal peptidase II